MSASASMKRAEAMAIRAPTEYATLKAAAEARVVRWQWASDSLHSYEPAYFEIHKFLRGKLLVSAPEPLTSGTYEYGYDAEGCVVVVRLYTEFPGRIGETFYVHEPNGIMQFLYDSGTSEKNWSAVTWFAIDNGRVVSSDSVSEGGNVLSKTYQYNDRDQMVRRDCRGINPPSRTIEDWHELEYDEKGAIVRIHWCYPDGQRILHFERATRKTSLKARKRELLEGLTAAILDGIRRTAVTDEVYVLVLRYFGSRWEHTLPPLVSLNTVPERERLMRECGNDGLEAIWNPCEWPQWNDLDVKLSPELAAMCAAVNQDIWQNEQEDQAFLFFVQLARALNKAALPIRRADEFVSIVLAPEDGDLPGQVNEQITAQTRKKLRGGGWLTG